MEFLSFLASDNLTAVILQNQYAALFLLPLLVSEAVIYFAGVSIGSGAPLDVSTVLLYVALVILYDTLIVMFIWHLKKRFGFVERMLAQLASLPYIRSADRKLKRYENEYKHSIFFMLLMAKTLPFSKILLMFFALRHTMPLGRFILHDTVIILIWGAFQFFLGMLVSSDIFFDYDGTNPVHFILVLIGFICFINLLLRFKK